MGLYLKHIPKHNFSDLECRYVELEKKNLTHHLFVQIKKNQECIHVCFFGELKTFTKLLSFNTTFPCRILTQQQGIERHRSYLVKSINALQMPRFRLNVHKRFCDDTEIYDFYLFSKLMLCKIYWPIL